MKTERHPTAGEYDKLCYRTACQDLGARWYNYGTGKYYCQSCAMRINRGQTDFGDKPLCFPGRVLVSG